MAQLVNVLATKSEGMNSIPRSHKMDEELTLASCLLTPPTLQHTSPKHKNKKLNIIKSYTETEGLTG